jgi:hypothetical protein
MELPTEFIGRNRRFADLQPRMPNSRPQPNADVCPGFNPMAQDDATLFKSVMDGEHCFRGFPNRDIQSRLTGTR